MCGCLISSFREIPPTKPQKSSATRRFLAVCDSCERARIRFDRFRNCLTVNKLSFAAAGDQSGFAQNLQVMRNGCRSDSAHGNDFSTVHVPAGGNGLINPQAGRIGKGFGDFFDLGAVHGACRSVADLPSFWPQGFASLKTPPKKMQPNISIVIKVSKSRSSGKRQGDGQLRRGLPNHPENDRRGT